MHKGKLVMKTVGRPKSTNVEVKAKAGPDLSQSKTGPYQYMFDMLNPTPTAQQSPNMTAPSVNSGSYKGNG